MLVSNQQPSHSNMTNRIIKRPRSTRIQKIKKETYKNPTEAMKNEKKKGRKIYF